MLNYPEIHLVIIHQYVRVIFLLWLTAFRIPTSMHKPHVNRPSLHLGSVRLQFWSHSSSPIGVWTQTLSHGRSTCYGYADRNDQWEHVQVSSSLTQHCSSASNSDMVTVRLKKALHYSWHGSVHCLNAELVISKRLQRCTTVPHCMFM